jgi:hypothetical protein
MSTSLEMKKKANDRELPLADTIYCLLVVIGFLIKEMKHKKSRQF